MSDMKLEDHTGSVLLQMSNAMVRLHKEQFGRGPTKARSGWTDDDTLLVTLREALLPAEIALTGMGYAARVQESRLHYSEATRDVFVEIAQELVGREVTSFASASDPRTETIWEIFEFRAAAVDDA